jgi:hypothetical protein
VKWFGREASLVTAIAALIAALQPSWLAVVGRSWLVVMALLASGAILSNALGHIPTEQAPVVTAEPRQPGDVRQIGHIEQANDFLLAVDYQLFPFLQGAVRDIAAQRLLVHHSVVLESDPERARHLLGEEAWQLIRPTDAGDRESPWGTISVGQLAAVADSLERL